MTLARLAELLSRPCADQNTSHHKHSLFQHQAIIIENSNLRVIIGFLLHNSSAAYWLYYTYITIIRRDIIVRSYLPAHLDVNPWEELYNKPIKRTENI